MPGYHRAVHTRCRVVDGVVRVKHELDQQHWKEDGHMHRCLHNGNHCICCDRDAKQRTPFSDDDDDAAPLGEVASTGAFLEAAAKHRAERIAATALMAAKEAEWDSHSSTGATAP